MSTLISARINVEDYRHWQISDYFDVLECVTVLHVELRMHPWALTASKSIDTVLLSLPVN